MSLDGLVLIDKPAGITSHDVVYRARRVLGTKHVGHAGTLDPFATGLLILLIGEATKISDYIRDGDKTYITKVKLGIETTTFDLTGDVVHTTPVDLTHEQILTAIQNTTGEILLKVPKYSAIKVNGEKLYEKARNGESFEAPEKPMHFYNIEVLKIEGDFFEVQLSCKKGGYIRSWGQHIGEQLKVGAHLTELRRIASSGYHIKNAIGFDEFASLEGQKFNVGEIKGFVPLTQCLSHFPTVMIRGRDEALLQNGQIPHTLNRRLIPEQKQAQKLGRSQFIQVLSGETHELLALLEACFDSNLKVRRVFKVSN